MTTSCHTCFVSTLSLLFVWTHANVKFRVARSRANPSCRALIPESPRAGAENAFQPPSNPEITSSHPPPSKERRRCVAVLRVLVLTAAEGNSDCQCLSTQQHHGNSPCSHVNYFIVFIVCRWKCSTTTSITRERDQLQPQPATFLLDCSIYD